MPDDILVLQDRLLASGTLLNALRQSFPDYNVRTISGAELRAGVLQSETARLLVMPGIVGENSPYPAIVGEDGLKQIERFARNNVVLTICAATYFVSRETVYQPAWGPEKRRSSLNPIFNGVARGPLPQYAHPADPVIVPVSYKDAQGRWHDAHSCYGNGPGLYPDRPLKPDTDILAVFSNVAGNPAALVRRSVERGAVHMSSILPEIGFHELRPYIGDEQARRLMKALEPHEHSRRALWHDIMARIRNDLRRLGNDMHP